MNSYIRGDLLVVVEVDVFVVNVVMDFSRDFILVHFVVGGAFEEVFLGDSPFLWFP